MLGWGSTQLLPFSAPFCNVDLTPKWAFDLEKATFLNCPTVKPSDGSSDGTSDGSQGGTFDGSSDSNPPLVGGLAAVGAVTGIILIVLAVMTRRERGGKPLFQ